MFLCVCFNSYCYLVWNFWNKLSRIDVQYQRLKILSPTKAICLIVIDTEKLTGFANLLIPNRPVKQWGRFVKTEFEKLFGTTRPLNSRNTHISLWNSNSNITTALSPFSQNLEESISKFIRFHSF